MMILYMLCKVWLANLALFCSPLANQKATKQATKTHTYTHFERPAKIDCWPFELAIGQMKPTQIIRAFACNPLNGFQTSWLGIHLDRFAKTSCATISGLFVVCLLALVCALDYCVLLGADKFNGQSTLS